MNDFKKGVIIFCLVMIAVLTAFTYIAKATVYEDRLNDQFMASCQASGYGYGDCFNVIKLGDGQKFSK